jgi:hypothetical protein
MHGINYFRTHCARFSCPSASCDASNPTNYPFRSFQLESLRANSETFHAKSSLTVVALGGTAFNADAALATKPDVPNSPAFWSWQ